jgi:deoxyribodipyrimidine photo-lyase
VTALVLFRDDLRLDDNPALAEAAAGGRPVVALFVLDEVSPGIRPLGGAAKWWLGRSLAALRAELAGRGVRLVARRGGMVEHALDVASAIGATHVAWNRRYGAAEQAVDAALKAELKARGVTATSHNAHLLYEPWEVTTKAGSPAKVFTPFWRAARATKPARAPVPAPALIGADAAVPSDDPAAWGLQPTSPDWSTGMAEAFAPGSAGAMARLDRFLVEGLPGYADGRNRPDLPSTSRLSPHLRFGEISVARVWAISEHAVASGRSRAPEDDLVKFQAELGWREFAYHLLHQEPALATRNWQRKFDAFPWREDAAALKAWRKGLTGYPIVDAGMRELWTTGWMHNRVRMIVGSFLVKHLLVDWRRGEEWFWDTLVDADPANNTASWQWVAGTGADAAPYFRVFNPVGQGEKFDPMGAYVRRWVPELSRLPDALIHRPFAAGGIDLAAAGVSLGRTYPRPIVDLDFGRERALKALEATKDAA